MSTLPAKILTIAGSDSGGGAGIEADLKTIAALGAYGMAAITAVTAQNTVAVTDVCDLPEGSVGAQIDAVAEDIGIDAAKTGMLSNEHIIARVARCVAKHGIEKLVIDPVMISKSGAVLLRAEAQAALKELLLPLAWMVTPNIPEAEALAGMKIESEADLRAAAEAIYECGPRYVLMKGGHRSGPEAEDWLYDGTLWQSFTAPRIDTRNTHGTGCTYSAAIATYLGAGMETPEAVVQAKDYLTGAIAHGLPLGQGHGPLDHNWRTRRAPAPEIL